MIQVREYATLSCKRDGVASLDRGFVSEQTLDWLLDLQQSRKGKLLRESGRHSVKLGSCVGYLQSPGGEGIEILPKTHLQLPTPMEVQENRELLRNMLQVSLQLAPREVGPASLQRMSTPLHEWIFSRFLDHLSQLVRRGLRFDYRRVEEESRFIRGRLDQTRQSRQTPGRAAWFHIQHDIYSPQRIENRLLKTALNIVLRLTDNLDNWRLANELAHQLIEIDPCPNPLADLHNWHSGKLMQPYEAIKPWCVLILEKLNPGFQLGNHRGIALLFPMERLFENYVAHWLHRELAPYTRLRTQACDRYLLTHRAESSPMERNWFQLKPDLLLETKMPLSPAPLISVMDTKWKLLDSQAATSHAKYNLSQADMYQLYAYGQKYMQGEGHMALIFPAHEGFSDALPRFSYSGHLHLWAVPFDLKSRKLVPGDWIQHFPGLRGCFDREAIA